MGFPIINATANIYLPDAAVISNAAAYTGKGMKEQISLLPILPKIE